MLYIKKFAIFIFLAGMLFGCGEKDLNAEEKSKIFEINMFNKSKSIFNEIKLLDDCFVTSLHEKGDLISLRREHLQNLRNNNLNVGFNVDQQIIATPLTTGPSLAQEFLEVIKIAHESLHVTYGDNKLKTNGNLIKNYSFASTTNSISRSESTDFSKLDDEVSKNHSVAKGKNSIDVEFTVEKNYVLSSNVESKSTRLNVVLYEFGVKEFDDSKFDDAILVDALVSACRSDSLKWKFIVHQFKDFYAVAAIIKSK
jgi:hypothetical protein